MTWQQFSDTRAELRELKRRERKSMVALVHILRELESFPKRFACRKKKKRGGWKHGTEILIRLKVRRKWGQIPQIRAAGRFHKIWKKKEKKLPAFIWNSEVIKCCIYELDIISDNLFYKFQLTQSTIKNCAKISKLFGRCGREGC